MLDWCGVTVATLCSVRHGKRAEHRLNGEMMEETGQRFGADGVEISAHGLCALDHVDIQGRQYRKAEWDRINGGLKCPLGTLNCHHYAIPIIYGVSRPMYSRKELAEINRRSKETVEWKGREMTRYQASQKQRQLEMAIRYAKDERDAWKPEKTPIRCSWRTYT